MKAVLLATIVVSSLLASAGVISDRNARYLSVAYWGQESNKHERSLADYCTSKEGFDILILSFLSNFGGGVQPNGYIGDCYVKTDGTSSNCASLISDIHTCKAAGKKIFISIGGGGAKWQLNGTADARNVASDLWNSYANPHVVKPGSLRPLGDTIVDGWDLDIESNPDNQSHLYMADLVNTLRGYFPHDTSNTYYISGAPQCPLGPIPDMNSAIKKSKFDLLLIQFYNNYCAAADVYNATGNPYGGHYNFAQWPAYLAGTASAHAKLLVGLPASPVAGNKPFFFVPPLHLPEVMEKSVGVAGFSGVMLWDAGQSDFPMSHGCNYAQEIRKVLDTGKAC